MLKITLVTSRHLLSSIRDVARELKASILSVITGLSFCVRFEDYRVSQGDAFEVR